MVSKSNTFEQQWLDLYFLNLAIPDIGDAAGLQPSATAGNLYLALHTADPGEGGNQSTSECAYTSYTRVAVARTGAGWVRSGSIVTNVAAVAFPQNTGSTEVATHATIGRESSGATVYDYKCQLSSPWTITNGFTPTFQIGEIATSEA